MGIDIYVFFVLFAAISSFNLGLFYWVQSFRRKQQNYMAIGTLIFSICLLFSYYELESISLKYPHLMWINGPLLFAVGPFLYLNSKNRVHFLDLIHFIPVLLVFLWILPFYGKSSSEKILIIRSFYAPDQKPEIEMMQYLYVLHIGLYCLLGYFVLKKRTLIFNQYNSDETKHYLNKRSFQLYLVFGSASIFSFFVCFAADLFGVYYGLVDKFTISLLVVLIILLQVYVTVHGHDKKLEKEYKKVENSREKAFKKKNYSSLILALNELMEEKKLYRSPDLKIDEVAKQLGVPMYELSAAINEHSGNNFFNYINSLRVDELKETLLDDRKKNLTLFAIAHESGFKSNSSFYRVFKKHVGSTPKEFIAAQHDKNARI